VSFQVIQHGVPMAQIARNFHALSAKARTEMQRGLGEGGLRVRTMVRRSLREQMNVTTMKAVNQRTSSYLNSAGLSYHIKAEGSGLPIENFKTSVTARGVWSDPWGQGRVFARSFRSGGKLRARRGSARFPVRSLLGPSPAKELVKDETKATFENAGRTIILPIIARRLAKLAF